MEERHTRNTRTPLQNFCKGLSVGENIIVWVSDNKKKDNPDKECVVKREGNKLEEAGTYSAIPFKKNAWIVSVQWYEFVSTMNNRKGEL